MISLISKPRSSCKTPTDIVTYRYNGKMVYVPAASSYDQALSHARDAFPQLKKLHDASLSLSVTTPGQEQQLVSISAPAWPKFIAHMPRYQIINVHVAQAPLGCGDGTVTIPLITVTYVDANDVERTEPVPPYYGPVTVHDEKASFSRPQSPSLSPSPSTLVPGKRNWIFQKFYGE